MIEGIIARLLYFLMLSTRMQHKASQKQFDEFDAWSFSRVGGCISSNEVNFSFPRLKNGDYFLSCDVVNWKISGQINAKSESVIGLSGCFSAGCACIACGLTTEYMMNFDRHLILVTSELQADAYDQSTLDENTEVVACPGAINLRDWLEDEILLAIPMFPRHETCVDSLVNHGKKYSESAQKISGYSVFSADGAKEKLPQERQHPFLNLGDLIKIGKK